MVLKEKTEMIIPSPPDILHLAFSYQLQSQCVQMLFGQSRMNT